MLKNFIPTNMLNNNNQVTLEPAEFFNLANISNANNVFKPTSSHFITTFVCFSYIYSIY